MQVDRKTTGAFAAHQTLSDMERRVLMLVAEGTPLPEISVTLEISDLEAERLLFSAEEKLGARNRLHAITLVLHAEFPRKVGDNQPE